MGASTVDGGQRTMSEPHADSALIAAIATPPGRGGIGIVRLSGGRLADVAQMICHTALKPRQATYSAFYAADGGAIDFGVALYFPAPHSYTGQDVLELQGHGGNAVLQMLLKRCLQLGARLAAPGEFTQRAFLNDKIDLAQAESVVDLIDASSAAAARLAMRSLSGEFSRQVAVLIDGLIHLRMLVEATLDFPDEAVDPIHHDQAASQLRELRSDLDRLFRQCRQGAVLRQGLHVVFIGQPNVGKSSLLNRLAGEEVAIVTPIAGTTRDSVRTLLHLDGVPIYVIDTAGLRATADPIEKIGIERTWAAIRQADLALVIVDATRGIAASDQAIVGQLPPELAVQVVLNKIDLVEHQPDQEAEPAEIAVSALTGAGLDVLRIRLLAAAGWQPTESIFLARQRHLDALQRCATHLQSAETLVQQAELFAEELRLAQNALSEITGEFTADDLLGEIFSRFCIGK